MEYIKLKKKLKEEKITYDMLSSEIGISKMSFHRKMNGTSDWLLEETKKISKKLKLNIYEYLDYFNIFFD